MLITNEFDRIRHFPNSELCKYLREMYESELEFHAEPLDPENPEPLPTPHQLAQSLTDGFGYGYDPLENTDGDDIARMWADMGYPLPHDVNDVLAYRGDVNDIALAALRDYVHLYDVEATAAEVLERLQEELNNDQV